MKDMTKRIFVFLLALTLCRGPAATVVYAQEQNGEPVAKAVDMDMEESAAEIENTVEPDDKAGSTEPDDIDTENTKEPNDEAESTEQSDTDTENTVAQDDEAESTEQSDADTENMEESADGGENEEQDSGDEAQPDRDDEQAAEESGKNPDGVDTELETIGEEEQPEEMADEDIVYTEEELYDWCSEHRKSGGQVTLGDNITITEGISLSNGNGHIIIDTEQYGLVYDGGEISLMGVLEIIGEGVKVPVLDIQTVIHYGYWWELGWNDVAQALNITATGKDGTGGVAMRVRQSDGYSACYSNYVAEGLIRSYGTGAIGLYLDDPDDVYCFQIEVEGDGSTAVYAPQGANLYYCKLTAKGAGASVVSGSGEIVVDTCATSPEPQDVQVVNYRIAGVSGSRLYYPVPQYGSIDTYNLDCYITFLLSAGDGYPSVTQAFWIDWQSGSINTSALGQITIQGRFDPPFQELGLEDDFPLEFTVDVRDPDIPCISNIWFGEDWEFGAYLYLTFWNTYERRDENVILWRSDDNGVTWYDFIDSPDIEWSGSSMCYYYGEINGTVMLQLEVLGKGQSNVVSMYSVDGKVCQGIGGDRDGGDRNIVYGSSNNETGSGDSADGSSSTDDNVPENEHSNGGINTSGNGNGNGNGSDSGGGSGNEDTSGSESKTDNKDDIILIYVSADIIQETEAAEIETAATPEEWEDGDTIAISGRRLTAMTEANPSAVRFIKNGIQISVSPADLLALGLGENQLFLVEIKKLTGASFSVLFRADDIELFDLPFVTYIGETVFDGVSSALAVCVAENGDVLPSEYDPDTGKLSISMTDPGVFMLQARQLSEAATVLVQDNSGVQEQDGQPNETSSPLNVGMIVVGMIVFGISAVFLSAGNFVWRKRRLARR